MRRIDKIILHCSATSKGKHFDVDEIRRWHVEGRGWKDIGYHYVVYLDGSIHNGRPVEIPGAHVTGHNKNSIGVCYVGGVSNIKDKRGKWPAEDTRTPEQKEALWKLLMELMACYDGATLHGHNEFAAKACPSFDVQKEYKDIIEFHADNK
jgi:N-acetylmuramoyl-L-alanine amidase